MARPVKNNCDYFPHDAGMRNHKKVKALRSKFGVTGYAVWSLLLEYITGSDGNVFPYTDLEFELMSGDFGVSATEIRSVVDYCIILELLFHKNGFVNSDSLDERLAPVYEKRGKAKELSKKQLRDNGKFASSNTDSTVVSVTEMPQSKVKEIELKERKKKESKVVGAGEPATIETRSLIFRDKCAEHLDSFSKETLRAFYDYWTEMNEGGRKMRFEMQKVFDIKKRLATWQKNESKGYGSGTIKNGKGGITAQGTLDRLNSYSD
ncbi:MAG: DUF4373 domain-containing protein [Flavobacterium sp.]